MKKLLLLCLCLMSLVMANAQAINRAEYYFNTDPGQGNGTPITVSSPGESVNFSTLIPTTGLPEGFHLLAIRMRDVNGTWTMVDKRGFYIYSGTSNTTDLTAAEYFFDHDPGPGNGTPVSTGTTGPTVNFSIVAPLNISPGFHFLGIRIKDAEGKWSLYDQRSFYLGTVTSDLPHVMAAEYFYDNDPGLGSATPLTITTPGNTITQTFDIPVPTTLSQGEHYLTIRVKNQAGNWSLFEKDTLTIGGTVSLTCPANTTVNVDSGLCTAIVNNIDPVSVPAGASYTYTLSGATTGNGNGTASGKTFNIGTTTVTYALAGSPASSCSFTVTVNSSVTPSVTISATATTICAGTSVTFIAAPINGGLGTYTWKVNGNVVGTNSSTYTTNSLANGDIVTVTMVSSIACGNAATVTSNAITMTVTSTVTPSVTIAASATTICTGTTVTFTAFPVNGGNNPVFEWILNNNVVGTSSTTYSTNALTNGATMRLTMVSSATCSNTYQVSANPIVITVSNSVVPSVSVNASATTICAGTPVTFTAIPVNGGTPVYQWKLNGNAVGTNSPTYENLSLANNDQVSVTMQSSIGCTSPSSVSSAPVTMTVNSNLLASVSITPSANNICAGTPVTFTATAFNGGTPTYVWKRNGITVGTNSPTYIDSTLSNNDQVKLNMQSSLGCAIPNPASSNTITMSIAASQTYYRDADGDGYGSAGSGTMQACQQPTGYVTNSTDCNDGNATVNPAATEQCGNGVDDNCNGLVDETCSAVVPVLRSRTQPVREGSIDTTKIRVEVWLDQPASLPVSVFYKTINGDAMAGQDYVADSGTLHIPPGASSGWIELKVIADVINESTEFFLVRYSQPVNVALADDHGSRVLIIDDDNGKSRVTGDHDRFNPNIAQTVRRNHRWQLGEIANHENEIAIFDAQGKLISRQRNYSGQPSLTNVAAGIYFYYIKVKQKDGSLHYYRGRLLVTD